MTILFASMGAHGREVNVVFRNLTYQDGLPAEEVMSSVRDSEGIVWIAGTGGLSRFDGYRVKTILKERTTTVSTDSRGLLWVGTESSGLICVDPAVQRKIVTLNDSEGSDQARLTHPYVTRIVEDGHGALWVGTKDGLNRIQVERGETGLLKCSVTPYHADENDPVALPEAHITALLVDPSGQLWVGASGGSVLKFHEDTNAFVTVWNCMAGINTLCNAGAEHLWVGTSGMGLYLLSTASGEAREMSAGMGNPDIQSALMTANGQLWVGTAEGLYRFNDDYGIFTPQLHEEQNPYSLANDHITNLNEDSEGILWVSTHGGLSRFDTNRSWFEFHRHYPQRPQGLRSGSILSMARLSPTSVAIGTPSGIDVYDRTSGQIRHLPPISSDPQVPAPVTLYVDREGTLWAGTRGGGLACFDQKRRQFKTYRHSSTDPASIPKGLISAMMEDSQGNFWIGTNGSGLALFDRETGKCRRYPPEPAKQGRTSSYIRCLFEDTHKRIWVGTVGTGLFRLDPANGRFFATDTPENGLGTETISVIHQRRDGNLWVGTEGHGILNFDPLSKLVERIHSGNSLLPHDSIFGIVEDYRGAVWFSTGNGLARMDPETAGKIRVFTEADGLQSQLFNRNAAMADDAGLIYFGGPSGFNVIHPDQLPDETTPSAPVLTGLELFGQPVVPGDNSLLKQPLHLTSKVRILFDPRIHLALTFATRDYANPSYSRFRYRLVGVDSDWVNAGQDRRASYGAIPPGNYPFHVQSSFDGHHWSSNSARFELEVLPLWYQRWWAKWSAGAGAVSLFSLLLAWILYVRLARIERHHQELKIRSGKTESELAKQLQRSMLIEQTAGEMHRYWGDSLQSVIQQLGEYFQANRTHLHLFDPDDPTSFTFSTEHLRGFHVSTVVETRFPSPGTPFVQQVIKSDQPVASLDVTRDANLQPALAQLKDLGTRSLLAMRTCCGTNPNGIIFLHQCDHVRRWQEDEIELLRAVAGQIGITIAQIRLKQREETQRLELEKARLAAEASKSQAEEARHMAEKANQAKSEFLARMTHELRTPLNAILGFAELIRRDPETTNHQRSTLDIIHNSGEHLLSIINDVLEVSKIEAGGVEVINERFDFIDMLKSVHDMLEFRMEQKGLRLVFRKSGDLPRFIITDKAKLRQVIINLLGNSLKFTEKGSITLQVRCQMVHANRVRIHFKVTDTGKGISKEELPKLFQKFTQTETGRSASEGTGLGLTISRSFVQLMGGDIQVASEVGKGTTFRFDITAEVSESQIVMPPSATRRIVGIAGSCTPPRILIVDDQAVNRMLLLRLLKPVGFELCEAENGQDAVEKCAEFEPHLILMDQDMPGMNGRDATRTIIERTTSPPVIVALTAHAMEESRREIFAAGCKGFLSKPFKNDDLFALLGYHLDIRFLYSEEAKAAKPAID